MPLPNPKEVEKRKDFISRCMGNKTMNSEYPTSKQRAAVCFSQWRKAKKSKGETMNMDDYPEGELTPEQQDEMKDAVKEMFPTETKEQTDES